MKCSECRFSDNDFNPNECRKHKQAISILAEIAHSMIEKRPLLMITARISEDESKENA